MTLRRPHQDAIVTAEDMAMIRRLLVTCSDVLICSAATIAVSTASRRKASSASGSSSARISCSLRSIAASLSPARISVCASPAER